ncbi:MAG: hypothetical protein MJ236_05410 [Clostridia bacterium]|nr:hypothetical protein [Clostridia bacterium]
MPKSTLTWYKSRTNRIMRDVRALKQKDIANEINESQQVISYRINNVYEKELNDWIRILNLAGYEITEKGE